MIFLPVGGGWVLASRWGLEPMGFREPIVLLTGVHFHFAGFALPILTGLAAGAGPRWISRLAVAGVVVGVPFVAVGISAGRTVPIVELSAAWFLAAVCLLVVALQAVQAVQATHWPERLLFALSGLALLAGMALAVLYALSTYRAAYWLTIPRMVPWHGTLNALGFAAAGAAGLAHRPAATGRTANRAHVFRRITPARRLGDTSFLAGSRERAGTGRSTGRLRTRGGRRGFSGRRNRMASIAGRLPRSCASTYFRHAWSARCSGASRCRPATRLAFAITRRRGWTCSSRRVIACFDEEREGVWVTGFTYRTLVGHPELGEETFSVEKDLETGLVMVAPAVLVAAGDGPGGSCAPGGCGGSRCGPARRLWSTWRELLRRKP